LHQGIEPGDFVAGALFWVFPALRLGIICSVFKEPGQWSGTPRLWRRAQFSMMQCRVIFALIVVQVCDGGTGKM